MEADGAPFSPLPPVSAPFLREFKAIATRIRRKSKQTQWFDATLVWNEYNLQNHDSRQDVSTLLPSAFFGGDLKLKLLQAVHSDCLPGSFELSAEIYFEPFEFGRMPKWDVLFDMFAGGFCLFLLSVRVIFSRIRQGSLKCYCDQKLTYHAKLQVFMSTRTECD